MNKKDKTEWIYTTREHSCFARTFEIGTKVKIVGKDLIRGYDIEDEHGNRIDEIGWIV